MIYQPGLHILAEITSEEKNLLEDYAFIQSFFNERIQFYQLNKLGEVFHNFHNGGYTAVICLTESHLSIHTWPEFSLATFDVFLSNYQKNNEVKCRKIFEDTLLFFKCNKYTFKEVIR